MDITIFNKRVVLRELYDAGEYADLFTSPPWAMSIVDVNKVWHMVGARVSEDVGTNTYYEVEFDNGDVIKYSTSRYTPSKNDKLVRWVIRNGHNLTDALSNKDYICMNLTELLIDSQLDKYYVCEELGISHKTLYNWLHGITSPNAIHIMQLEQMAGWPRGLLTSRD